MNTRRNFLKHTAFGLGALTYSSSMGSLFARTQSTSYPQRFIFIRKSNGTRPHEVALPTLGAKEKALEGKKQAFEVDLDKHELPVWLRPLAKYKSEMCILQGLSAKMSENSHASYQSVMGAFKSGGNSIPGLKRATIDYELGKLFPSPFVHVELALRGDYAGFASGIIPGYSVPAPHQRNYCYADPETAYNELFKAATNAESMKTDSAMYKFLEKQGTYHNKGVKGYEKYKLSYLINSIESIQERNRKLQSKSAEIVKYLPSLDKVHANGGVYATTPQKQEAFTEVLLAALITGLTNSITYTIDELPTPIIGLPGNEGDKISIHELGHGGGYGGVQPERIREKIRIGHTQQIARMVERLKEIPEGKGSMFDNTTILYFPENGEEHHGLGIESPFIIMAGANSKLDVRGRYIRLPFHCTEGHKTISNLYTTLLNAHGNPIKHYGDMDVEMATKKLAQAGAIKQFLS